MHKLDSRAFRLAFATIVLFTGVAGDFWRNLLFWQGYGVIVVAIALVSVIILWRRSRSESTRFRPSTLPYPLLAFLVLAFLSIFWSFYPGFTMLGASIQFVTTASAVAVAITLTWHELLLALGWVFRLVLGMSFIFELIISTLVRHPIYPVWIAPSAHSPQLEFWSRNLLFDGGKIQGIVGSSSLLAMAALLGLIVFILQLASRSIRRGEAWFWIVVAVVTIAITRSATIFIALVVVSVIASAALLVRRARTPRSRNLTYGGIVVSVAVFAIVAVVLRSPILSILGKSDSGTGRTEIWREVIALAQQRTLGGWGWLSYWIPWIAPFDTFKKAGGVQPPHAHNAWLDVWLQLGIIGLVVFGALILTTLIRSWLISIDRIVTAPGEKGFYSWVALLPLLMLTAQLVQSLAESRILLEGGWMLLVIWSVKSKLSPLGLERPLGEREPRELRSSA